MYLTSRHSIPSWDIWIQVNIRTLGILNMRLDSLSKASMQAVRPKQPPTLWVSGAISPTMKWLGSEVHHTTWVSTLRMSGTIFPLCLQWRGQEQLQVNPHDPATYMQIYHTVSWLQLSMRVRRAVAKTKTATSSLPVRIKHYESHLTDFLEISYLGFILKFFDILRSWLK